MDFLQWTHISVGSHGAEERRMIAVAMCSDPTNWRVYRLNKKDLCHYLMATQSILLHKKKIQRLL